MMDYVGALAHLAAHSNYDVTGRITSPSTERIERLMAVMGEPQRAAPAIHITGTNGKGSTAEIITRLLVAQGLTVGTFTSPHLERVNERLNLNGEPISDEDLAEQIGAVADLEVLAGVEPSYFEIVTAAAFRWFADIAVDAMVVEVGLLGRWDATNVVDGQVAVVTNVSFDHLEYAGPTLADVASEKAGIVKPGSTLVLGETDPELAAIFRAAGAARVYQRGEEFDCLENQLALGGRQLTLRTPTTLYPGLYLPLHGRHQGDNAAAALTAVEAFFDAPLSEDVVEEGFAAVRMPGRFEVLGHQPLVILDGAHNPPGADTCASVLFEDFNPVGRKILVVGFLLGRDPQEMLEALRADELDAVICCTPSTSRAVPAAEVARAARAIGCDDVSYTDSVADACDAALARATADDLVLVTGSLYVVGHARAHLRAVLP
ncbi:MAG TPA: folylpolyglutamate synthase/dihydrofolate synthase family protein [Acidimicrobiales bacterium]|nr:folylpolyglutamate synthase/dihydrofolate synthase family protein [Acidimicrobiales bacterium]